MTTMPIAPAPTAAPPGVSTTAGSDNQSVPAPGDFLALVQQALTAAGAATPATPGGPAKPGKDDSKVEDSATEPGTDADPAVVAAAAGLTLVAAPVLPVVAKVSAPGASHDAADATSPVPATGATPVAVGDAAAVAAIEPAVPGSGTRSRSDDAPTDEGTTPAPGDLTSTETAVPDSTAATTVTPEPTTALPTVLPASPVTTATSTTAPTGPAPVQQVTGQVFPEVTGLVSRGDGTHRITLTLKPEALGEVRVVMTVRDGAVHVRLAAGHEARQALLEGSSELTRLLERVGASDTRIVVRELGAAHAAATGPPHDTGTGTGNGLGPGSWTGGGRPHDQHAGTRADQPATDGTHDGTRPGRGATGANPPRSNEPVTHTRAAGVDVTM